MTKWTGAVACWALAAVCGAVELKDGWKIAADPANAGVAGGWAKSVRADAKPVAVPGVIQTALPRHAGVAWYYFTLGDVPAAAADERLRLFFGAVDYFSEVFLDGVKVGQNEGAENPFSFDVTGRAKKGALLAVRVVQPRADEPIDGFELYTTPHSNKKRNGVFLPGSRYNTGGIVLPVLLEAVPAVRVTDAFVRADWQTGRVTVETTVANDTGEARAQDVDFVVRGPDSPHPVARRAHKVVARPGETAFSVSFDVPGHKLWSPDVPNVYELAAGDFRTTFGFRDFRLVKGWFTLNGKRVFLKSTHTGGQVPGGLAVPHVATPELEFKDFQLLKAMGFNCVRFIAGQATPRQLDHCDRLGLMVYQETMASWDLADGPEAKRRYLESIRAEIRRDRNHPCLAIFGALNETRPNDAFAAARGMLPEIRKLDPDRLWLLDSGRWDLLAEPKQHPSVDWSVGSASNPGSTTWECVWGNDGKAALNASKNRIAETVGDNHLYPPYPYDPAEREKIRTWGRGTKPCFLSEFGMGSLLNVVDACLDYECRGISPDAPDYALMRSIRDRFLADWSRYGLDRVFASPADFLRASDRMNARSRRDGFDLVRANPRHVGHNMTGALDHAICGEGPITFFRRIKPENFDAVADGWSDLRWCLFLDRGHYFADETPAAEAVLADFDVLADGDYEATFSVTDEAGVREWSRTVRFSVPQKDEDGLRAVAYPVFKGRVFADLKPGRHVLHAELNRGGFAAAHEKAFWVSERPVVPKPPADFVELRKGDEPQFAAAMAKVAAGATALVHLDDWRNGGELKGLPVEDLRVRYETLWLYHSDAVVLPHAFTEGMRVGFYDWDWWTGCFAHYGFTAKTAPESVAAMNFYVGGPGEYYSTLSLATYRHGKGRLILSTLPMDWNSPAGMRLRANVLKASGAKPDGEPDLRAWAKDCGVRLPNRRPGGWGGYRPRGVLAWECTVAGAIDPKSVQVLPTYFEHAFNRGGHWEMDDVWGALGFTGPAHSNEIVDVVYNFDLQRLDSVVRTADGKTALRFGAPRAIMPKAPALAAGETRLTNLYWRAGKCEAYPVLETAAEAPACAIRAADKTPRTLAKLRNGEPVTILAWGDSVTECGFLPDEAKWQEQFVRRLRAAFPKSEITLVSNGWGGRNTQSFLAEPKGSKHNYEETVLAVKPDLVVSEFVNDAGLPPARFGEIYAKLRDDFARIGAEWVALTPHYVRCDWMGLGSMKNCSEDPRPYVKMLRAFCATNRVGLADASLRWGHLWKEGVPHETLFVNNINHPNAEGMSFFADALMAYFGVGQGASAARRPAPNPVLAERLKDDRMDAYGLVHWGPNTYTDREWGYGDEDPKAFDPKKFDADKIVAAAKAGGLGGVILVAKHHDGFCLWPTKTTDHNVSKSPFRGGKGDVVKEFAAACRKAGLRFGVYVSPWDRHDAKYGTADYVARYHRQIKELLGGDYGEIFEMWFDGANGGDGWYGGAKGWRIIPKDYYRFDEIFRFVRELQPKVCIFNERDDADFRWPGNEEGLLEPDCRATVPHFDPDNYAPYMTWCADGAHEGVSFHPPEADFPLRRGWFYHAAQDGNTKSGEYLMKSYLRTVGNGGTMNLGLSPNKDGELTDEDVAALKRFGEIRRAFFAKEAKEGEPFNVVVMREDVSRGERVDEWSFSADGRTLLEGRSIGTKRIRVLEEPAVVRNCAVKTKTCDGGAADVSCTFHFVDPVLLAKVLRATCAGGETDTAKWMQGFRGLSARPRPMPAGASPCPELKADVDGKPLVCWTDGKASGPRAEFAFSLRAAVTVAFPEKVSDVAIEPAAKKLRFYKGDDWVSVVVNEPGEYAVAVNGGKRRLKVVAKDLR
ncbi:MAG: alpha-L-fucosidase [Kiritimatiellae bacterium]|nr:alpha-L-fucosidase [Kiritimatiellia bacterium]